MAKSDEGSSANPGWPAVLTRIFQYVVPILIKTGGTVGVAAASIWFGSWFPDAQQSYLDKCKSISACELNSQIKPNVFRIAWVHFLDLGSPVPYTAGSLLLALITVAADMRSLNLGRRYKELSDQSDKTNTMLRSEKEEHAETRRLYNEAIEYILKFMFRTAAKDWWGPTCRVTIYRHTGDHHFKRIFRYADQTQYQSGGRVKIPDREGVVGAAWLNEGIFEWRSSSAPATNAYRDDLRKRLDTFGVTMPSCDLTMPARAFLALAVKDINDEKIAIIVVESTDPGVIGADDVKGVIEGHNHHIARLIKDKGRLDEILNPDCS